MSSGAVYDFISVCGRTKEELPSNPLVGEITELGETRSRRAFYLLVLERSFPISRTVAVLSQAMAEAELEDYTRSLMTDVPKEVEDWVFNSPCIKIRKTTTARIQASSSLNHTSPLLMQPAPQQHSPSSLPAMQVQRPVLFLSLPQPTLMQVQRSQPSPSALP